MNNCETSIHNIDLISHTPGMIPINIDIDSGITTWRDFGQYHVYEGRFSKGCQTQLALATQIQGQPPAEIKTPLEALASLPSRCIKPSLFIFHISRCGSTLLARALAQSRANLVYGEPVVVNQLWNHFLGNQPRTLKQRFNDQQAALLQALISQLGRQRIGSHQHYAIKFSSLYCLLIDQIAALYPETPMLFIYREPLEVLVSIQQNSYGLINDYQSAVSQAALDGKQPADTSVDAYSAKLLNVKMQQALHSHHNFHCIDYRDLTKANLPFLLKTLGINSSDKQLSEIQRQFDFYSKADYQNQSFQQDSSKKQKVASEYLKSLCYGELNDSYQQLKASAANIRF